MKFARWKRIDQVAARPTFRRTLTTRPWGGFSLGESPPGEGFPLGESPPDFVRQPTSFHLLAQMKGGADSKSKCNGWLLGSSVPMKVIE